MIRLRAICVGHATAIGTKSGMTGHLKRPIAGPVQITTEGAKGDCIVDRENHGGTDQALYLFTDPDRIVWEQALGRPLPDGAMGENLVIDATESAALCVGDMFTIGDVVLQVTSPRIPCATFAAFVGNPKAVKQFFAVGRPGAYLRVLHPGTLRPGDAVTHTPWDGTRLTLATVLAATQHGADDAYLRRVLDVPAHHKLHAVARERLG